MLAERHIEGSRTAKQDVLQRPHGRSAFSMEDSRFPNTAKIR